MAHHQQATQSRAHVLHRRKVKMPIETVSKVMNYIPKSIKRTNINKYEYNSFVTLYYR